MRHRTAVVLAALALALVTLASAAGVAFAHAKLVSSTPADGATVQPGLTQISLTFSEDVSVDQSSADLLGPGGAAVSGAKAVVNRAERTKMAIQTPPLSAGTYMVKWRSVTEDDNGIENGSFSFTVAGTQTGASAAGPTAASTSTGQASATPTGSQANSSLPVGGGGSLIAWLAALAAGGALVTSAGLVLRRRPGRGA